MMALRNVYFKTKNSFVHTCDFKFIRLFSSQLLIGDVIQRTQNDNGPLEIGCKWSNIQNVTNQSILQTIFLKRYFN